MALENLLFAASLFIASPKQEIVTANPNAFVYVMNVTNQATEIDTGFLTVISQHGPPKNSRVFPTDSGLVVHAVEAPVYPDDTLSFKVLGLNGVTWHKALAESLGNYKDLQLFMNGFGLNVLNLRDSSGVSGKVYGIVKFNSNPNESLVVAADTAGKKFTDFAANAKLLSGYLPGAEGTIKFVKSGVDGYTNVPFTISEANGMGMYAVLDVLFPQTTGIEIEKTAKKRNLSYEGAIYAIYDVLGRKVPSIKGAGIYFVIEGNKVEKKVLLK
ncbi:MAG: hypothetical protein ACPLXC_02985 [Candidatus Pacearchaeota archaeon]